MRIVELYSHLNGREHILVHKPDLWHEIESVIAAVDAAVCRTKISKEQRSAGKFLYSPVEMNSLFTVELSNRGWNESRTSYWVTSDYGLIRKTMNLSPSEQRQEILQAGKTPISSYNQIDFLKTGLQLKSSLESMRLLPTISL